jgi:hypothetical protein
VLDVLPHPPTASRRVPPSPASGRGAFGCSLIWCLGVLGGGLSGVAISRSRCRVGWEIVGDPVPGKFIADPDMEVVGSSPGAFRLRADFEVDEEAPSSYRQRMDGFASFDRI